MKHVAVENLEHTSQKYLNVGSNRMGGLTRVLSGKVKQINKTRERGKTNKQTIQCLQVEIFK